MSAAANQLERIAARLRGASVNGSAARVAEVLDREVKRSLNAGKAPDGERWAPTQLGKAPLRNAANQIRITTHRTASSVVVTQTVRGHYALHDLGRAKGAPRRQVLPDKLTPGLDKAIRETVVKEFRSALSDRR